MSFRHATRSAASCRRTERSRSTNGAAMNWALLWAQLFNGLTLGALLVLVAMGLTIIFGALGVINFAHGAFYMIGAYAGFVTYQATHSFVLAMAAGACALLLLGLGLERILVRYYYRRPHEDQILMTFGLEIGRA